MLKNYLVIVFLIILSVSTGFSQTYRWEYFAKLNLGRRNYPALNHAVVFATCKAIVAGGYVNGSQTTARCEILDACCNKVTETGQMNIPRSEHILLLTPDSNVIAISGVNQITDPNSLSGTLTTTVEIYNRSTGTWTSIGNLNVPRRQGQGVFINNDEVYICGGRSQTLGTIASAEIFNIRTGVSRNVASLPMPLNMHVVGRASNGDIIIASGRNGGTDALRTPNIIRYNPATDSYTQVGTLPNAVRSAAIRKLLSGNLLISGGIITETIPAFSGANFIERESGGNFSAVNSTPTVRWGHAIEQLSTDSVIFIAGGITLDVLKKECEWYNPTANTLNAGPSLPVALGSFSSVSIPVKKSSSGIIEETAVLVIGGVTNRAEYLTITPRDTIFILRKCKDPDTLKGSLVNSTCATFAFSIDSVNLCRQPSTIRWSFGDDTLKYDGMAFSAKHAYTRSGAFTVRAMLLYATPCPDTLLLTTTIIASTTVDIKASPKLSVLCPGDVAVTLHATGGTRYLWTPANTLNDPTSANPIAKPLKTTTYVVQGWSADSSCTNKDSITVIVSSTAISAGPDRKYCVDGDSTLLQVGTTSRITSVRWTPKIGLACDTCAETKAKPRITTTYIVTVVDDNGCVLRDTVKITVAGGFTSVRPGATQYMCYRNDSALISVTGKVAHIVWIPNTGLVCDTCPQTIAKPAKSTVYKYVATDSAGCSSIDSVIVDVLPKAKVDAFPDTTICTSTAVLLTVTGSYNRLEWSPIIGLSCSTCPQVLAVPPKRSIVYTVTAHNGNSTDCDATDSVRIRYAPGLEDQLPPRVELCTGDSVRLSLQYGGKVKWSSTVPMACDTCKTIVIRGQKNARYIVVGDSLGCLSRDTVDVVIQTTTLKPSHDTSVCVGSSVILHANANSSNVVWTPSIGLSCSTCPDPIAFPTQTTRYYVTAGRGGCILHDSILVNVLPKPDVRLYPNDTSVCRGETIPITLDLNTLGSTVSWEPHPDLSCLNCLNPIARPQGNATYTVIVRSPEGCDTTMRLRVTVSEAPLFTFEQNNAVLCEGEVFTVRMKHDGKTQFRWVPSTGLDCDTCPEPRITATTSTTFTVRGFYANNSCDKLDTLRIVLNPLPNMLVSSDTTICELGTAQLQASGGGSYQWLPTDGLSCSNCPNPIASPKQTTRYTLHVTTALGCVRDTAVTVLVEPCNRRVDISSTAIAPFIACDTGRTTIAIINSGNKDIRLDSIDTRYIASAHCNEELLRVFNRDSLPRNLAPLRDTLYVPVEVIPEQSGRSSVKIVVHFGDSTQAFIIPITAYAHPIDFSVGDVPTDVVAGTVFTLPIKAHSDAWAEMDIRDSLIVTVWYDSTAILYADTVQLGSALGNDWKVVYQPSKGGEWGASVFVASGSSALKSDGEIIRPSFRTMLSKKLSADFRIEVGIPRRAACIELHTTGTEVNISGCAILLRRVHIGATTFGLRSVKPNPVGEGEIVIEYGIGFNAQADIRLYDARGGETLSLASGMHQEGVYSLNVSTQSLSSGMYLCVMNVAGQVYTLPINIMK